MLHRAVVNNQHTKHNLKPTNFITNISLIKLVTLLNWPENGPEITHFSKYWKYWWGLRYMNPSAFSTIVNSLPLFFRPGYELFSFTTTFTQTLFIFKLYNFSDSSQSVAIGIPCALHFYVVWCFPSHYGLLFGAIRSNTWIKLAKLIFLRSSAFKTAAQVHRGFPLLAKETGCLVISATEQWKQIVSHFGSSNRDLLISNWDIQTTSISPLCCSNPLISKTHNNRII